LFVAAVAAIAGACIVLAIDHDARAQIAKTIRAVVPYAPGGAADIVARLVAERIGRSGGPVIVVENRPGAGGAVGTETVARAVPDGNTVLVVSTPFLIDPLLRTLNYDPISSFAPICNLVNAPTVIVVNSASPYRTLAELLDDARAKPGQITMASIGPASSFQLGFEMLKRAAKVDMTFVPYPRQCAGTQCRLGPAGNVNVRHFSERVGIFESRKIACSRDRQRRAGAAIARRSHGRRVGLSGLRRRCLVWRFRSGKHARPFH